MGLGKVELGLGQAKGRDFARQGGLDHDQARRLVQAYADDVAAVGVSGAGGANLGGQVGSAAIGQAARLMSDDAGDAQALEEAVVSLAAAHVEALDHPDQAVVHRHRPGRRSLDQRDGGGGCEQRGGTDGGAEQGWLGGQLFLDRLQQRGVVGPAWRLIAQDRQADQRQHRRDLALLPDDRHVGLAGDEADRAVVGAAVHGLAGERLLQLGDVVAHHHGEVSPRPLAPRFPRHRTMMRYDAGLRHKLG